MIQRIKIIMVGGPITVDGVGYIERESCTCEGFYSMPEAAKSLPATSRVPVDSFWKRMSKPLRAARDVILTALNAGGSAINESAQVAAKHFFDDVPGAVNRLRYTLLTA